ncbi:MAG TPA: GDP-mannose 4,6-dehydratase [Deinococcales bacterium]|nr:GDP-mannose 4,6-dehydratase [Deinococcales bacterium]
MTTRPPESGTLLLTGAAGFIGANFSLHMAEAWPDVELLLLDKMSPYSTLTPIQPLLDSGRARFLQLDLADENAVNSLIRAERPAYIVNLAAESHNDRAIVDSRPFVHANVLGAYNLLEAARIHGVKRFVHVSTIEVYGEQGPDVQSFTEGSPLNAKTPYSASKAAAELLVRAHMQTYPDLDLALTHCANNYGPWQFPEKLVPLAITNILSGKRVPLYGDGLQKRDWLHVQDHCRGLELVLNRAPTGIPPEAAARPELLPIFDFSARAELSNRDVIKLVTDALGVGFDDWTEFVPDRPNHDRRYLIDPTKAERQLGFQPAADLERGMAETVAWYRDNRAWWEPLVQRSTLQFDWGSARGK